jgi:hypothetical protein
VPAFKRGVLPNKKANTANVITTSFFPMFDIPCVVWRIEPGDQCEVAKENAGHVQLAKAERRRNKLMRLATAPCRVEISI